MEQDVGGVGWGLVTGMDGRKIPPDCRGNILDGTRVLGRWKCCGLGLHCCPAALVESPAMGPVWSLMSGSRQGLAACHFFTGGFARTSGLSLLRVMVLGEAVGSRGHVKV